jgi:hypothetical protein
MKKKIYLIEPHSHVEVLYRWVQCLQHTSLEWEIITSDQNYASLCSISKAYSTLNYKRLSFPLSLPQDGLFIFVSLQTNWKAWKESLKNRTYLLTIHNVNTWFYPAKTAAFLATEYDFITYSLKYLKSVFIDSKNKESLLKNASLIIPYSSVLKLPVKFSGKTLNHPLIKQDVSEKDLVVVIPFYKSPSSYNIAFLKDSLHKYLEQDYTVYILSNDKNRTLIEDEFYPGITFLSHPISTLQYYRLIRKAEIICYPVKPNTSFNIYSEVFGNTKYSGWLRDGLEFSCTIDAPPDLRLEPSHNLQTAKEYAHQLESQLDQLELIRGR